MRKTGRMLLATSLVLIGMLLLARTPAESVTLQLTDDAFTNAGQPTTPQGVNASVVVRNTGAGERQGFLRFDMSPLPPGAAVARATLRLWVGQVTNPGQLDIHVVQGSWDETTLTAATAPPLGPPVGSVAMGAGDQENWVAIDVTSSVQDWYAGLIPNHGYALRGSSGDPVNLQLDSKENTGTSHPAELVVALFDTHAAAGTNSTAIGADALASNTGDGNTAVGAQAAQLNTSGSFNTALGYASLHSNTTGVQNAALGVSALINNTTGFGNTALGGYEPMRFNTTGSQNTALGNHALRNVTTGSGNIVVGFGAGQNVVGGNSNIQVGSTGPEDESGTIRIGTAGTHTRAFVAGVRGVATSVANGVPVLVDSQGQLGTAVLSCPAGSAIRVINADGTLTCETDDNSGGTITGVTAGAGLSGGGMAGAIVLSADTTYLQRRVTGTCLIGQVIDAIDATGGVHCKADLNSGGDITGVTAGFGLTGGGSSGEVTVAVNTGVIQERVTESCPPGSAIRAVNPDGTVLCETDDNSGGTITGVTAGAGLTGGGTTGTVTVNIAFAGSGSASSVARSDHTHEAAGTNSTAIGADALAFNAEDGNTAVGVLAAHFNTFGHFNTALGYASLHSNTTGAQNAALGVSALVNNTTGSGNTALGGYEPMRFNTTGSQNTALGNHALRNVTTGSDNVVVGFAAGQNIVGGNSNIQVGSNGPGDESGTIRIGTAGTHTRAFVAGVHGMNVDVDGDVRPVYVSDEGQLGTAFDSSRDVKDNIRDMAGATEGLYRLRPVMFRYRRVPGDGRTRALRYGLVAEEVAEVYPELVLHGSNGKVTGVRYDLLTPMLLNELQRLRRAGDAMAADLEAERQRGVEQTQALEALRTAYQILQVQHDALQTRNGAVEALADRLTELTIRLGRLEALTVAPDTVRPAASHH